MSEGLNLLRDGFGDGAKTFDIRRGLVAAVLAHAFLIAAIAVPWRIHRDVANGPPPVIPVDLVSIGDSDNIIASEQSWTKPEPKDDVPSQRSAAATPAAPQRTEAEAASAFSPSAPADPPAALATRQHSSADEDGGPAATTASLHDARLADRSQKGVGSKDAMTLTPPDALRNAIARCWIAPAGATHLEQFVVTFELVFNPDGSVSQPPQLTPDAAARAQADPSMREIADAVRHAIYTCAPYNLPAGAYDTWHRIDLVLDPSKLTQY